MNLYQLIEDTINDYSSLSISEKQLQMLVEPNFEKFISDNDKCANFVTAVSNNYFQNNEPSLKIIHRKDRASHSIVTWLLGIAINKKYNIFTKDQFIRKDYLWTAVAMNHDYGYFIRKTYQPNIDLDDITKNYDLFADEYYDDNLKSLNDIRNTGYSNFFSYSPDEIKNYYKYAQSFHNMNKEKEKNDHGIIGGCELFKTYCESIAKQAKNGISPSIIQIQTEKIACYNIASHNIFKSGNPDFDKEYLKYGLNNLLFHSKPRVNKENGLLMLLSLVDTIECYKIFSRTKGKYKALNQKTILKNINICFNKNHLILDFTDLFNYINKRKLKNIKDEMIDILSKHVRNIAGINKWTDFGSSSSRNSKWTITIKMYQ